jgi:SNF2 family DNA or RNA helicase
LKTEEAGRVRESAKLELLMTVLPEMLREGRRILLFSQFTSMLALIEDALRERGIDYLLLTGATRDRETLVDRFQREEVPLFLISLKAGGVGLNLTAADTVIHYDPWWNPAVENQATDRAHRIGQDKPVFVYKLLSEGTVEEKIAELQARKRSLAEALFAESAESLLLDDDSIAELFAPLD